MTMLKDNFVDNVLAATGSTQTDAAVIHSSVVYPTAASTDGTKGVKLPQNCGVGTQITVFNRSAGANNLKVYTYASTGYIDGTAGSTASTVAQNKGKVYTLVDRTAAGAEYWVTVAGA